MSSSSSSSCHQSGEEFKAELRAGKPKYGIFVNSASSAIANQLSQSGYDWLLVDMQHGLIDGSQLGALINAIHLGKSKVIVRVGGHADRAGIQQSLDLGADGILIPYVNNRKEVEEGVSCCLYPTKGTRSVYHPQPSNSAAGLLGYVGNWNKNAIVAIQIETADSIKNIEDMLSVPGLDMAFLGQNDLCMSMGLYEKYKFPEMYTSTELNAATQKLVDTANKNKVILGLFLFGTDRVGEFLKKGFTFISVGNDLHHVLTATAGHLAVLANVTKENGKEWTKKSSALI